MSDVIPRMRAVSGGTGRGGPTKLDHSLTIAPASIVTVATSRIVSSRALHPVVSTSSAAKRRPFSSDMPAPPARRGLLAVFGGGGRALHVVVDQDRALGAAGLPEPGVPGAPGERFGLRGEGGGRQGGQHDGDE